MGRREIVQRVIKGVAATIESYPPFFAAPADATLTARIGTPAVKLPATLTAIVDVDNYSTSTTAAADEGDTQLAVTGIHDETAIGRRYLVFPLEAGTDDLGTPFPIEMAGTSTPTTLILAEPLPRSVAALSLVTGWRVTVDLSTADTASLGDGVVEWRAEFAEETFQWATPFRIVERTGAYQLTGDVLTKSSAYAREHRPDTDPDYMDTIDAAWRLYLRPALSAKQIREEQVVSWGHLEAPHIRACELVLAEDYEADAQRRAERRSALAESIELALAARDLWIEPVTETLDPPDPDAPRAWTITRVTR